jgi:arsenate reductase
VPDPVAAEGDELARKNAFRIAYRLLENRIRPFVNLRIAELDRLTLKRKVDEIGDLGRN